MNMDIKDLIAKLKGNGGGDKRGGGLTGFFDKNPKMKIIIPAICLGISVLVALVIIFTTGSVDIDNTPVGGDVGNGSPVDVLPQGVRDYEDIEVNGDNVFDDVVLANAKYTGLTTSAEDYKIATIETEDTPLILMVGDYIGSSSWLVEDITEDEVIIALGESKIRIEADF